jgi:hypothetical protein
MIKKQIGAVVRELLYMLVNQGLIGIGLGYHRVALKHHKGLYPQAFDITLSK